MMTEEDVKSLIRNNLDKYIKDWREWSNISEKIGDRCRACNVPDDLVNGLCASCSEELIVGVMLEELRKLELKNNELQGIISQRTTRIMELEEELKSIIRKEAEKDVQGI